MPRTSTKSKAAQQGKPQIKSPSNVGKCPGTTAAALKQASVQNRQDYCKSGRTREAYKGHVSRGKAFLAQLVAERQRERAIAPDGINTNLLAKAFDNPPNEHSVDALEMFLSQKCFTEACGHSTAEAIQAAFADHWDNMDGEKYAGPYMYNQSSKTWTGCPARAKVIYKTIRSIKNKDAMDGAQRRQAEAMTLDDLTKVIQWSEAQCPPRQLVVVPAPSLSEHILHLAHGLARAFMSTGFTLWTRNFELCKLRVGHVDRNLTFCSERNITYFTVHLMNRKGWTSESAKGGPDGPLQGNIYEIHPQPGSHAMDMFTHLRVWMNYLEYAIGRILLPDDHVFPYISPNGQIHIARPMSHDYIQTLITRLTTEAGLEKRYTMHCFRRGGAQHRFMFAPSDERWSLNKIRWWGGWTKGEHVDTLMKYLFNSLQQLESDYGDALCPVQRDHDKSFMGNQKQLQPLTREEFQLFSKSLHNHLSTVNSGLNSLHAMLVSHPVHPIQMGIPPRNGYGIGSDGHPFPFPAATISIPPATHAVGHANTGSHRQGNSPPQPSVARPTIHANSRTRKSRHAQPPPIPGTAIAKLPRGPDGWRVAVKQWDEGLKDWDTHMYKGNMREVTAMNRKLRETIALEYNAFNRDERKFLERYPEANKGVRKLIEAIRRRHGWTRRSRKAN